jgi:hypothetical protein
MTGCATNMTDEDINEAWRRYDNQNNIFLGPKTPMWIKTTNNVPNVSTNKQTSLKLESKIQKDLYMALTFQNIPNVRWLDSVVTEAWIQESERSWVQARPSIDNQVSDPQTVIGFREDGIVVWKYRDENKKQTGN